MMALSCLTALFLAAVCLLQSAEGGKPICLNQPPSELPRDKRMAENGTSATVLGTVGQIIKTVQTTCYRGDPCCFSCSYDTTEVVKGFDLIQKNSNTKFFECDAVAGPQLIPDSYRNYIFEEEQQKLCLTGFRGGSETYVCKIKYEDLKMHDALTENKIKITDKLGTPTVSLQNKGPIEEGEKVNWTCSLDTKEPDLISAMWYNGTNVINSENRPTIVGNRITFWIAYTATRIDNGKEIYCNVTDGDQTKTSPRVPLDVQYTPRLDCNVTAQLVVGRPAEVNCSIDANPEVPSTSRFIVFPQELIETGWVQNGCSISTSELKLPCSKTFTVTANNTREMGEAHLTMDCWFEVYISHNRTGNTFTCKAEGNPVPEISWALKYKNGSILSYNSTASTVHLDDVEKLGVTDVICRADQRQRLYFEEKYYVFNLLEKQVNSSSNGNYITGIVMAFLVALGLGIFLEKKCQIWKCLKQCCTNNQQSYDLVSACQKGGTVNLTPTS
ncbi:Hypp8550 [Branchiostoma lanceolatum]|uniref:Hypp8550 protein n=1 Tax=Branchiostoma lanceolatum TaxID=7740 RepID=A0A8J9Z7P7_BRALA|nr:Hypp8550 [Branchiostoma lanceolatum]